MQWKSRSTEYRHWQIAQAQYYTTYDSTDHEELDNDPGYSNNSGGQSSVAGSGSDEGWW